MSEEENPVMASGGGTESIWKHSLFACFGNVGVCLITYLVPCYTAGKVAEAVGDSCPLCCCIFCIPVLNIICGGCIRRKVREKRGIKGSLCGDIVIFFCCPCCALVQEARETDAVFGSGSQSIDRD